MTDKPILAADCQTMTQVREGVDAIDRRLIALFAERFGYMSAAARIKSSRDTVRDETRKAEVIANAKSAALDAGLPIALIEDFWERLVEASIAYEMEKWDALHPAD